MPNDKWDDDRIENLLRDFPAIKDERPKEEVYNRLKNDHKPKKKPTRWIPALVAALAFITFGVLLASMMGQGNHDSALEMSGSENSSESADSQIPAVEEEQAESERAADTDSSDVGGDAEDAESFAAMEQENSVEMASVYAEDLDGNTVFTIGLTENAVVIPVSFLISDERLQEDFGTIDVDAAELYNFYAAEVDEEALGFDDYHPYSGMIESEGEGIQHMLPADHSYDMASAAIGVYFNSLSASFPDAAEITILDEAGEIAEFDQVGPVPSFAPAVSDIAYYSFAKANGDIHLAPGYDMPFDSATEALEAMQASPSDLYAPLIPADLDYTVSETDETVTVNFVEAMDFDLYDYQFILQMIEGMALSADSFGKALILENTASENWDRFNFTESLPVPAGTNLMAFTE